MAVELYAGTLADFNDSMAKEIEDALAVLMGPLPSAPQKLVDDRRKLFIAIANGVINHLKDKQDAFEITYRFGVGTDKTTPNIQVKDGI
jgi:hypothetical protein